MDINKTESLPSVLTKEGRFKLLTVYILEMIQEEMAARYCGTKGLRDRTVLNKIIAGAPLDTVIDSLVSRGREGGAIKLPSRIDVIAQMVHGIVADKPFADCNKQTAFVAACVAMEINGMGISAIPYRAAQIMNDLESGQIDVIDFSLWLSNNTR